ncbi:MAG: DUF4421 domain-containing protein, partial [Chitinophagales bacterium]|nr:DUF4421 domain-containing protein [Chitinophagales bacterium]
MSASFRYIILVIGFTLCWYNIALSQEKEKTKSVGYDSSYVKQYTHFVSIENAIGRSGLNVLLAERGGNHVRYAINQKTQLGFKLNWRFINFGFGVTIPFFNNDENKFGKTTGYNFNFASQIKRRVLLDIYFLNQKTLYVYNAPSLITDFNKKGNYPVLEDLRINYLGLDGGYLLNNKKFTFKAPFNANERQLKSAGTFTVGGYLFYSQISNSGKLVGDSMQQHFNQMNGTTSFRSYNIGLSLGYGYNFVIKKHGLISTTGHAGFGPGISAIKYEDGHIESKVVLSGRYKIRLIGAYMNDKISAGVRTLVGILPNSANNNMRIYYETDQVSFFFSIRFLPDITKNKFER